MKKFLPFVFASVLSFPAMAAGTVPPELVGEWASKDDRFDANGFVTSGAAAYLGNNGFVAVCSASPLTCFRGTPTYDPTTFKLTIELSENMSTPPPLSELKFVYDPMVKTLTIQSFGQEYTLSRRGQKIPAWVLDKTKSP
jgi:hypothetical protein